MPDEQIDFDAVAFGHQFSRFLEQVQHLLPDRPSALVERLTAHLGRPPEGLPIVSASFPLYQHANLQVGIDAYLAGASRTADLIGLAGPGRSHQSFAEILAMA